MLSGGSRVAWLIAALAVNGGVVAVIAAVTLVCSISECGAAGASAFQPSDFDRLDNALYHGDGYKTGTGDSLAWAEAYLMLGYVEMYRATGEARYLDKLVDHADHVLANRDDNRSFKDYSGRSRPAWSVGNQYTVAELILKDEHGVDTLKLRSTRYAFNNQTTVLVRPSEAAGLFDLILDNPYWKCHEEYIGLSIDRRSPDFVERRVNARDWVAKERKIGFGDKGSNLVTVEVVGEAAGMPIGGGAVPMQPLWMAYHGYSGQITFPMLDFARIVRQNPKLRARYGEKAEHYVLEAAKVFRDADKEWRDGPGKGEGYYVFGERGCPFWSDNVPKPFNYLGSEGLSLVRLGQLTKDRRWEARAKAIARLLKRQLQTKSNGSYVWNYWWGPIETGWTRDNSPSMNTPTYSGSGHIEDTSHGALEVYFAALCADAGWVFDKEDMRRFARTFLGNIVDSKNHTLNDRVDGKAGWGKHNAMVAYWMELAKWEPEVAKAGLAVCEKQGMGSHASCSSMLSLARAIKWGK